MIALDTNVLLRFLVEDDAEQTRLARMLVQEVVDQQSRCFLTDIVLCELVWVLETSYRFPRSVIVENLEKLLRARHLEFQSRQWVERAVDAYKKGRGDFADYLIQEVAESAGCDSVATFDRALHGSPGFTPPTEIPPQ